MFDQRRALHAQRVKPCLLTGDLIGGKGNVVSNSGIFVSLLPACHVLSGRVGSFGALSNAHNGAAQNNEHCRGACSHAKNIRQRKQKGSSFSLSIAGMQRTTATLPGTMPSSRAALVAYMTSSTRPFSLSFRSPLFYPTRLLSRAHAGKWAKKVAVGEKSFCFDCR